MPLINQIHVDSLLSNVSLKHKVSGFIAMDLFPEVSVKKSSDLYRVYQRNFRIPETKRAAKAEARQHSFDVSTATYVLERHALKDFVSDTEAENYDLADLRAEVTEELTEKILMRLEKSVADMFTTTSWSQNVSLAATACWNATTTVDPVSHFDTGTALIVLNAGVKPNVAAMGLPQFQAFKNNFQVLDRIKYTSKELGPDIAGALIGVDKMLIATASNDTAALGASDSVAAIWGDFAVLAHAPKAPGPLKPSAGYIFRRSLPMVKRWRVEERESECVEVNMEYQAKVVSSLAGFMINNVTT